MVGVILSYKVGLIDMNMVALTTGQMKNFGETIEIFVNEYNLKTIFKIWLFFGVPRMIVSILFYNMSLNLVNSIYLNEEEKRKAVEENVKLLIT